VREANVNAAQASGALVLDQKDFMGNARVVVDRSFTGPEGLVLRHSAGVFYQHRETHYAEAEDNTVRSELWEFLDRARTTTRNGAVVPFRPAPSHITGVADALKAITHLAGVRPPLWLDDCVGPDPIDVVSLRNGLFHIPTRALLPHTSKFFTLNTLPFAYDCDATAPAWEQFLADVWGDDQEMIDTLQEILGYLIASDTSMQKMFMLIGPRRSGKGTIGRVINALIGKENISGPTLASLTTNFGLQPLIGKLIAIVSDARAPGRDHQTIVERLLMISGQDAITVDRKNLDAWVGEMTARVVIMSNEALQLGDSSGALVGRFVVLQMHRSFYGTEDVGLTNRLLGELPGIFNWALVGRERLYKRGFFVQPAGSADAVEEMTKLNSPITEFMDVCCEVGHDFSESKDLVFAAYKKWCFKNDRKATNKVQFSKQLYSTSNQVSGMKPRTGDSGRQVHVYAGLKLKDAVRARVQASMFEEDDDVFG
jgi:putative DNA primase/helicase